MIHPVQQAQSLALYVLFSSVDTGSLLRSPEIALGKPD